MKIILSRKGFDSANGGIPSPILPNGQAVSLPIPASRARYRFKDLNIKEYRLPQIMGDLGIDLDRCVHLDPDIDNALITKRPKKWRGAFGQLGASQSHLRNHGVGKDDLFVYFGWFREVELNRGKWRFVPDAANLHVIYGWLFVESVLPVFGNEEMLLEKYEWLENHPHLYGINDPSNTIYTGSDSLKAFCMKVPGYGTFDKVRKNHILTDISQENRSVWKLPSLFMPNNHRPALSYHGNID